MSYAVFRDGRHSSARSSSRACRWKCLQRMSQNWKMKVTGVMR
jgi:hypothetical protein